MKGVVFAVLVACACTDDATTLRFRPMASSDAASFVPPGDASSAPDPAAHASASTGMATGGTSASGAGGAHSEPPDASPVAIDARVPSSGGAPMLADAATPNDDATSPHCAVRHVFYADTDADGFGDAALAFVDCDAPAGTNWSSKAGDCDDRDARVHPAQTTYFGESYTAPNGHESFDYDCSGDEERDPAALLAPTDCALLAVGSCGGSGYLPTSRSGAGLDGLCGSTQVATCTANTLVLCARVTAKAPIPAGCR